MSVVEDDDWARAKGRRPEIIATAAKMEGMMVFLIVKTDSEEYTNNSKGPVTNAGGYKRMGWVATEWDEMGEGVQS